MSKGSMRADFPGVAECVDKLRALMALLMDEEHGEGAGVAHVNDCIRRGMAGERGRFWAAESDGRTVGTRGLGVGA